MDVQQKVAKLQELLADKAFAEKLLSLDGAEEVQAALKEKGLELTLQDIGDIRDAWAKQAEGDEEMDADNLRQVAGGSLGWACIYPEPKSGEPSVNPFVNPFVVNTFDQRRW